MRVRSSFIRLLLVAMMTTIIAGSVSAQSTLQENRNRLLDGYATRIGATSRADAWNRMTDTQKGVFLTITDMLGERAYLTWPGYRYTARPDGCNGNQYPDCTFGCSVEESPGHCLDMSGEACFDAQFCDRTERTRSEVPGVSETMLDHVTRLWAIRDGYDSCFGSGNRMFFSADDLLMTYIRNRQISIFGPSNDPMPPHAPFSASHETYVGQPRGQIHFWDLDWKAVPLSGDGVEGVYDPHAVEIDIDYTVFGHPSNPQCLYGGTLGRYMYEDLWKREGRGTQTAELGYNPNSPYNPIDDPVQFVRQHYYDFLKVEPDFGGWNWWADQIRNCGSNSECIDNQRIHVSRAFWFSGDFLNGYYAQSSGLVVAPGTAHPFDTRQFVRLCYLVYLKREPDEGGWNWWTDELNRDLLNDPNDSGYNHIINSFLKSTEYRNRFGQP